MNILMYIKMEKLWILWNIKKVRSRKFSKVKKEDSEAFFFFSRRIQTNILNFVFPFYGGLDTMKQNIKPDVQTSM